MIILQREAIYTRYHPESHSSFFAQPFMFWKIVTRKVPRTFVAFDRGTIPMVYYGDVFFEGIFASINIATFYTLQTIFLVIISCTLH